MKVALTDIARSPLAKGVLRTISRHRMLVPGDRVLAAVSGGADSTALLHVLSALAHDLEIGVAVAHLNHGLRGRAADQDERFVKAMSGRLGLVCHSSAIRLNPDQGSIEERGRRERYAFFKRLAEKEGYTKTALGHHMDDNAEAVLMHLLRGSGIRGLSGIPPVRDAWIVRPLIDTNRAAIIRFLQTYHIDFVQDASNADLRFDRNRIRHHLMPLLQKDYNPKIVAALNRTADLCRQEELWLRDYSKPLAEEAFSFAGPHGMALRLDTLGTMPQAMKRRLVRDGLRRWQGHLMRINVAHIDRVIDLAATPSIGRRICLPNRIGVERTPAHLNFTIRPARGFSAGQHVSAYCYQVPFPDQDVLSVEIADARCRLQFSCRPLPEAALVDRPEPDTAWFDPGQLDFPLIVRNFRPGDRLQPSGMQGSQKIKKIFADRKIDADQRRRIPLLISGAHILWVIGVRRGALAKPVASNMRALKVERVNLP